MKLRNLILGLMAVIGLAVACQNEAEYLGIPKLYLSEKTMSFEMSGGSQDLSLTATRDWTVETDADWVVVSPEKGMASLKDSDLMVTVLENTGFDREADIKFSIGMMTKTLTVTQAGPEGSLENLIVYANDYDKVVAEKTYGSGSSWPYLDQFDGWMNQTGTGAAAVTYNYSGMSARANSTSDSNYSDYTGSGNNNMFFGANAYLATKNITLDGSTDFELTFGAEKYSQDNGSIFLNSEFHVYLSQDGEKWVELKDYTFAGGTTEGRWNVATAVFSVPEGTETLSICMKTDVASSYRMDDVKLSRTTKEGVAVDFADAVEMNFTAGGSSGGGSTDAPESLGKKTVEEFISLADTQNYYELTGTVSGFNSNYCSFDLTDETGKIYVYSVLASSKAEWASKIKNGGTITIYGKYLFYAQKSQHEVVDAYIVSYSDGGSTGGGESDGNAIYSNNYDKAVAEKTYGSGSSWPYLDQFDGWQNGAGTGASNVTYKYNGTSVRANSTSDSNYSDYSGSGNNNIFFGSNAYFSTNGIALNGATDLTLTFGTEKYSQSSGSVFKNSEFHIWLSNDGGAKWVEFTDYTFAGGTTEGRWNVATANFTVPSGTETLSVCFVVDVASSYRMDDFKLVASASAGTSVDFSGAVEKDFSTDGGSTGGGDTGGSDGDVMTLAQVIAASNNTSVTTSGLVVATYTRGILLKDDTAYLLVYDGSSAPAAVGDKVTVSGTKTTYAGLAQIGSPSVTVNSTGNAVTHPSPAVLDGAGMDAQLGKDEVSYIEYEGKLAVSGYYYNVTVDGASTAIGSLSYIDSSFGASDLDGKTVKVRGYFIGVSSSKYVNTMVVSISEAGSDEGGSDEGGSGEGEGGGNTGGEITGPRFVKVTEAPADWTDGSYLIVYEDGTSASVFTDGDVAKNFTTATISGNAIAAEGLTDYAVTIEAMDGGYAVKAKGGYLYGVSGKNDLCFDAAQKLNSITMESDGVKFVSDTSVLRFYSSGDASRFRYYKSSTYTYQNPVQLYKYVAE